MAKETILISIDSFYDGGAEMNAIRMANALMHEYEVFFFELLSSQSSEKRQMHLLSEGIQIIQPELSKTYLRRIKLLDNKWFRRLNRIKNRQDDLAKTKAIFVEKLMRKKNIRIVNTHAPFGNEFFAQLKTQVKFMLITTLHGHYELFSKQWQKTEGMFDAFLANHIKSIDNFIYTTNDQRNTLVNFGIDEKIMTKIYYGYEMLNTSTDKVLSSPVRLVLVSRAIQEKGWQEAISAVINLNASGEKVELTLVGDGPIYNDLYQKYFERSDIKFAGHQNDTGKFLEKAHIGLLPTYYEAESFPNTIIEYLSFGLPVISSRIGAIEEMAKSNIGIAGVLLDTKRGQPANVNELIKAIQEISNPQFYSEYVKKAYAASNKFKIEIALKGYNKLFSSI